MSQKSQVTQPKPESKDKHESNPRNDEQSEADIAKRVFVQPKDERTQGTQGTVSSDKKPEVNIFNNSGINVKPPQTGGIFGGAPAGLFGAQDLFKTSNIFGGAMTGLFSQPPLQGASLFNNIPEKGASLFNTSNQNSGSGLFSINFQAPAKTGSDNEDDDEGGDEPQKDSDDDTKKEIVMKYEYKPTTQVVVKCPVLKFRKNQGDLLEKGTIAIEKVNDSSAHLVIYRNNIQAILYQGVIQKDISSIDILNGKNENLAIKVISQQEQSQEKKEGQSNKPYQKDTVKLMFNNSQDATNFREQFEKFITKSDKQKNGKQ